MHVHCLHWLKSTGLLSLNAFCRPWKSTTGEMAPKEGSNLAVGTWYGSHCWCTSVKALQWNIDPLWVHVHVIATLNSTICVFFLLWLSFCQHSSHSRAPPTHPLIYTGPILMNFMKKIIKTGDKQPLSTYQVSCT